MSEYIVDFAAHNIGAAMALCDGVHGEIVRCKDCAHGMREGTICAVLTHDWEDYWFDVEPEGFCKWSERKGNE